MTTNMPAIPEILTSNDLTKVIKILKSQIENNNGLDKLTNQISRDHKIQTQRKEMFNSNLMISNEIKSRTKEFLNFKKEQDKTSNEVFNNGGNCINLEKMKNKAKQTEYKMQLDL